MSRYFPLLLLSLIPLPVHAASLQLCPGTPVASPGAVVQSYTTPEGKRLSAIVTEAPGKPLPNCRVLPLDVAVTGIQAIHFLPPDARPGKTILLRGVSQDKAFAVSEHLLPADTPAPAAPAPLPFSTNLLAAMRVAPAGDAARAQASLKDGRLHLQCRAGAAPAGVALHGPWYPGRADAVLRAAHSGAGEFTWRAPQAGQDGPADTAASARMMGRLGATRATATTRLALPADGARTGPVAFTLLCPPGEAHLTLHALTLEPGTEGKAAPRASWAWSANEWRERGAALLDWAAGEGIGEVFVNVPLRGERVAEPQALAAFVRAAGSRGIRVSAFEGDPRMVLPGARRDSSALARAYAAYNAAQTPQARLHALQFDVDPAPLPAHVLAPEERGRRYLALAAALRRAAGGVPLEFVVPAEWSSQPGLLRELARHADALTVKVYRTDPEQIYRNAVPFLDWGAEHGKRVRIALEAGPVGALEQRRYLRVPAGVGTGIGTGMGTGAGDKARADDKGERKGPRGDLLLFRIDGQPLVLLLKVPAAHPQAQAYAQDGSRTVEGAATSFHTDRRALRELLPRLERTFGAWDSFGGIAVHGLR